MRLIDKIARDWGNREATKGTSYPKYLLFYEILEEERLEIVDKDGAARLRILYHSKNPDDLKLLEVILEALRKKRLRKLAVVRKSRVKLEKYYGGETGL